jgi:serine/threonine protein kinase
LLFEILAHRKMRVCSAASKLLRVYETKSEIKILLEFVQGNSLMAPIRKKKFNKERDVRLLAIQLLLSIDIMDKLKIVHRDLNPQNIILNQYATPSLQGAELIIIDFGSAYLNFGF